MPKLELGLAVCILAQLQVDNDIFDPLPSHLSCLSMILLMTEWAPPRRRRRKEGGRRSTRCSSPRPPLWATLRPGWIHRPWDIHPPPARRHRPSHQRGTRHGEPLAVQPVHAYAHRAGGDWRRPRWVSCLIAYLVKSGWGRQDVGGIALLKGEHFRLEKMKTQHFTSNGWHKSQ